MFGEGTDLWVGGEEAAGFDDAVLPVVAVELEGDEWRYLDDWLDLGEVLLGLGGLKLFECGLLGGVGAEGVFVGSVGCDPEGVAEGFGVVVGGGEFEGAVAAAAAAVGWRSRRCGR